MSALAQGTRFSFVCEANSDVRLDSLVATHGGLSRTQAATLIANGHVTLGGRREKASYKPVAGESVDVFVPPPAPREILGEAIPLAVVYEDDDLVVIDKPHFLPTTPGGRYLQESALVRLRTRLANPDLIPIHRLDRPTAGLVMFSARPQTRGAYQSLFERRRVTKVYEAVSALPGDWDPAAPALGGQPAPVVVRNHIQSGA